MGSLLMVVGKSGTEYSQWSIQTSLSRVKWWSSSQVFIPVPLCVSSKPLSQSSGIGSMPPHFLADQCQCPHSFFGASSRHVPCSQFLWSQLDRAEASGIILLWPTLEHAQYTERTSGAKIKICESLKTANFPPHLPRILYLRQIWVTFHENCEKVLQWHKGQFLALNTSLFQGKGCYLWTFFSPRFDFRNVWNILPETLQEFSASISQPAWKLPAETTEAWQSYKHLTSES